jgi:hypothetical protein
MIKDEIKKIIGELPDLPDLDKEADKIIALFRKRLPKEKIFYDDDGITQCTDRKISVGGAEGFNRCLQQIKKIINQK